MEQSNQTDCAMCKIGIPNINMFPAELKNFIEEAAHEFSFLATNKIYDDHLSMPDKPEFTKPDPEVGTEKKEPEAGKTVESNPGTK